MNIRESMMFLNGVAGEIEKAIGAHLEIGDADLAWNPARIYPSDEMRLMAQSKGAKTL